ncbi:hypothetical protein ACTXJ2_12750 [Psychrobacter alimentarius]|uniref:hypothetical protein n=1 Tax=Psychrobacter TaxID=497 RepID=UPI000BAADF46|nr:hypothetical protein [Psychrobacter sp. JB193]PAT62682.1 hypothetical protein CIK80_08865 [Psychrobacter sp. JB193]
MYPEIVKLNIEHEIDGFERTTLTRLLNSFGDIELEATEKRRKFLEKKSKSFNPDIDDEASIEEDAYFEEVNHFSIEKELRQEFLNSTATWLFHLFEKQKNRVLGSDKSSILKPQLAKDNYDLSTCPNWAILNKELRLAANVIKHGFDGQSGKNLKLNFPHLIVNGDVVLSETDIRRYITALRCFWEKVLENKVIL